MNCCVNCFTSSYLTNIIKSNKEFGNCEFCGSVDVNIFSTKRLLYFFRNIINLYEVDKESKVSLWDSINEDFTVLEDNCTTNSEKLFKSIVIDESEEFSDLMSNNVSFRSKKVLDVKSSEIHTIWDRFKEEIKFKNRFHINEENLINLEELRIIFKGETFKKTIEKGESFYRCRISSKVGYKCGEMWNPPSKFASSGRANPKGISYLYLGSNIETTLYETRASLYDYVTVGEFRLKEDVNILDLRTPEYDIIPWSENDSLESFIIYGVFIKTLQKEISLPIRKQDKELDYIPTQYISEYIKSLGFDGVEYQSSLDSSGYNLAIFNPQKFECIKTNVYDIHKISLDYKEVKN
ncbi:hypothetical protein FHR24_000627 [Wenyingzhuangia heitensis]|uniref:RES domain-containing protein n=1 Tax=Wenyingzhuangia heitensis TaxID=1487859 RepID=A0ABX0U5R2_9FLAO|nr:RES domain-containing protein [Wenyingzhuangia heitensis]NIJ44188.1 hypothetical protein [Wenyingzhuangia heitensis]